MLDVLVFVCGAALMALEIVAARVLAPTLGNSIFVWGSVISSVMVALSVGYWAGGHIADRFGAARTMGPIIAGAGVLTVLAPIVASPVLPWAADLGPRAGALAASALIFFLPSLLLAMVTPLGVRLAAAKGMAHIGRSAGRLSSISTAGSILGTLATSFWLIPLLSLEPLIVSIGFLLLIAAAVALFLPLRYGLSAPAGETAASARHAALDAGITRYGVLVSLVLIAAGALLGGWVLVKVAPTQSVNAMGEQVIFRQDTQYHRITVTESGSVRNLRFDASRQSGLDMRDGITSAVRYPDYIQLAMALKPDTSRALVLGLGGGIISKRLWHDFPAMKVDSVEIDPVVIDVAKRYFAFPDDSRLRVFNMDARRYVQTTKDTYGLVVVDAYYADALPFHLTTQEFFTEAKSKMTTDGVLAYNVISALEGDDSKLFRSLYRTVGTRFRHLWVFSVNTGIRALPASRQNIIVLATDADVTGQQLLARIASGIDGHSQVPGLSKMGADQYTGLVELGDVPLLTDAYAPTDSLITVK
jgi:predicted membrane-bound spermidine synthase